LLEQRRIDGLWHEAFKHYIRMALIGLRHEHEPDFESTVRRAIDCRGFGYTDLSQAVIYLTSHDLGGFRNERLFEFFTHSGWPEAPQGLRWHEVSQDRMVEETRVGREPLYAWEAKVYTLV
jgi:pullulanase